ncbi:G-D-S-L family lipolytic protein [Nonlabens xiamenensis]|uniref:G-D-S-L family lipolytic protein n=1 Tax=Nonlabens xiamenensis TaxID=2341043 RepID=UPI0013DDDA49|nr:G-D-S-L family lipolytic protein [Nonlabens xiamenensis]
MKNNLRYIALLLAGVAIVGCEPEFDNPIEDADTYTSGEADFSKFVTVGNSLTAGFADGALYRSAQQNSFPAIIAGQMELAGGGEFNQPLMDDNLGGLLLNGVQILPNRFVLASDGAGTPVGPAVLNGTPTTETTEKVTISLNNFGVPGARVYHLPAPNYGDPAGVPAGTANPYFARFSSSNSATVIADAAAANGTFFTLWIGNNDILGYATSGGVGVDNNETMNVNPATQGSNSITNNNVFAGVYQQLVAAMTANGAKGALVNIPDVTSIPFFTTVPFAPLDPTDATFAAQIPALNAFYQDLNQAFVAFGFPERQVSFSMTAASPLVVRDETLVDITPQLTAALTPSFGPAAGAIAEQFGQIRPANSSDLITFTSAPIIGQLNQDNLTRLVNAGIPQQQAALLSANGLTFAMQDQNVLTQDEQDRVTAAQQAYNNVIQQLAADNGLAYVDARAALADVAAGGVGYNGGVLTSTYANGGAFSLDGVHPTGRGYAFTANVIIDAINAQYGSTLPRVDIGNYPSVQPSDDVQ